MLLKTMYALSLIEENRISYCCISYLAWMRDHAHTLVTFFNFYGYCSDDMQTEGTRNDLNNILRSQ